jgi:hypothetical protein
VFSTPEFFLRLAQKAKIFQQNKDEKGIQMAAAMMDSDFS